ncbi:unnamed protein product [Musa acuminata var. zebrina]
MARRSVAMRSMLLSEQPWRPFRRPFSLPPIRSSLLFFPNLELGLRGVPLYFGVLAATPRRRPPVRMNKAHPRKPSSRRFPVNLYPTVRRFTAIGTGDDEFVQSMVVAIESVIQKSIPKGRVSQEVSSRDKYVSANIGPIRVISSEQVPFIFFLFSPTCYL